MKKLLLLVAMFAFVGTAAVNAQCSKSKTAHSAKETNTISATAKVAAEKPACTTKAAAMLASQSDDIEAKTCSKSGKVSYYRKSVCQTSGKAYSTQVKYDAATKSFVNSSPAKAETTTKKKACTAAQKAACSKKASATKVAGQKAACSKSKAKTTEAKAEQKETKAKLVKSEGQ